ncbi:hypothetical protein SAMN04488011_1104 [Palleronia pelagia]|uniref:Uncharacterized protein n=1 Tax=Palleronia pelagia TaxID=387096 RepID=A0A1H8LBQ8_9RHOB|nr:hypothetical protein SAMN04488011_1104 [Palleronia pelagia]
MAGRQGDLTLEIIRLAVMLYIRFPLSLCNVEDLLNAAFQADIVSSCAAPPRSLSGAVLLWIRGLHLCPSRDQFAFV